MLCVTLLHITSCLQLFPVQKTVFPYICYHLTAYKFEQTYSIQMLQKNKERRENTLCKLLSNQLLCIFSYVTGIKIT